MNPSEFPEIHNSFKFKCTLCANCCTGDQKVHLNLNDLYKIAVWHGFQDTGQLFNSALTVLIKTSSNVYLPRIRFKQKPFQFCPYLQNEKSQGLCKLHPENIPFICSLAPVGRVIDFKTETDRFYYVKPAPDCPGDQSGQITFLDDIKDKYAKELEYQKRFFKILNKLQQRQYKRSYFLSEIYTFPINRDFELILSEIEQKIKF